MAFKSVINEYYARDISRKIRAVKKNQALKGEFAGGHAPYGYVKSPDDKHVLIPDPESAAVVKRMFEMADNGLGTHQIARIISDDRILIPTLYKCQMLGIKTNRCDENFPYDWRTSTVRRILESRVYIGDIASHKYTTKSFKNKKTIVHPESEWIVVEGMHEPLVERDVFDRVQKLIKLKKKANSKGITNVFAGILKCSDCGGNMTFRGYNGKAGHKSGNYLCNKYRHCSSSEVERKTCTAHYTIYADIYTETLRRLNSFISANLTAEEIVSQISANREPLKIAEKALIKLKKRNDELNHIIRKIVEQNALGEITSETFTNLYSGYINEQNEVTVQMKALQAKLDAENNDKENARLFVEQVRKHTVSEELTREMILDLLEKIVVFEPSGDRRLGNRQQEIEFHYRFIGKLPDSVCSL